MARRVSPAPPILWTPDQVRGDGAGAQGDGAGAQGDGAGAQGDGAGAQGDGAGLPDDGGRELEPGLTGGNVQNIRTVEMKAEPAKIIRATV